jgi:hypothetical protein
MLSNLIGACHKRRILFAEIALMTALDRKTLKRYRPYPVAFIPTFREPGGKHKVGARRRQNFYGHRSVNKLHMSAAYEVGDIAGPTCCDRNRRFFYAGQLRLALAPGRHQPRAADLATPERRTTAWSYHCPAQLLAVGSHR